MQNNHIEIEKLQERMGNCFIYLVYVIGDDQDKYRSTALVTHGAEYMRLLWNNHLTLNQKYHLAMMAKISMFTVRGAAMGFLNDRWEDMAADTRAAIVGDALERIRSFKKTAADLQAATDLGVMAQVKAVA